MRIDEAIYNRMPKHLQDLFIALPNLGKDEVMAEFDKAGVRGGGSAIRNNKNNPYGSERTWSVSNTPAQQTRGYTDTGSAARFFYCAKAAKSEREKGLEPHPLWLDSIELIWDNNSTNILNEVLLWERQAQNPSMVLSGEALHVKGILGVTTPEQGDSGLHISSNGKSKTDLYLRAIRYTIETGTRQTTELITSNWLRHLNTSGSMEGVIETGMEYGLSPAASVGLVSLLRQIITKGAMVYPPGAKNAVSKTQRLTSARDVLEQSARGNIHSTVKPIALMRYLVRLTKTPTGGVVLDPFMGSGTTGIACVLEGRDFIGIDEDAEYCDIARRRIAHWTNVIPDEDKDETQQARDFKRWGDELEREVQQTLF